MTHLKAMPAEILLVEDNVADVRLTIEALKDAKLANRLHVAEDGVKAMEFLRKKGAYADVLTPDLVLLDLNLPRKDGREVLAEMKADPVLRRIPVVVLTTSDVDEDILRCYDLHANCYVTKPLDFEQFPRLMRVLDEFWLSVVRLPPNEHRHN